MEEGQKSPMSSESNTDGTGRCWVCFSSKALLHPQEPKPTPEAWKGQQMIPFPLIQEWGFSPGGKTPCKTKSPFPTAPKRQDKGDETRRERGGNAKHQNKKQSKVTNYEIKPQLYIKAVKPSRLRMLLESSGWFAEQDQGGGHGEHESPSYFT